jgi:hypothetical protein
VVQCAAAAAARAQFPARAETAWRLRESGALGFTAGCPVAAEKTHEIALFGVSPAAHP